MPNQLTRFHYQTQYAIETFLIYVFALSKKVLKKHFAKSLSEKGVNLLELIEKNNEELEEIKEKFNSLIHALNKNLPPFPQYSPYPSFQLSNEPMLVCTQIIIYQNFLNQEFRNGELKYYQELPLFETALDLWKKVATPRYTPKEAMKSLGMIIKKGNRMLSQEHQYPIPQYNQYATKL